MKRSLYALCLITALCLFVGCASAPSLDEQILGTWEGSIQGFDVTLIYGESEITVDGFGMSFPYSLEGNKISMEVPEQGKMTFDLEIEGDEMRQIDPNSGEVNLFKRKM